MPCDISDLRDADVSPSVVSVADFMCVWLAFHTTNDLSFGLCRHNLSTDTVTA